ncbi:hypothetical protein L0669_04200 [Flavobacterium bizetiae]|uniref:hypothetical protein n=1 Tax=Flavobacterium bizetiae TaxID=2704140 RepID=UPI0021E8D1CE|nr:hypothetical protein [Flavobacterium bizetiae]UTN05109.1 hypothetical protein L0669_04200 [Flavobacterium bizetiae]
MNLKLSIITLFFFTTYMISAQQIGERYAPTNIPNFSAPIKSGIYNGLNSNTTGMAPDQSNVW